LYTDNGEQELRNDTQESTRWEIEEESMNELWRCNKLLIRVTIDVVRLLDEAKPMVFEPN